MGSTDTQLQIPTVSRRICRTILVVWHDQMLGISDGAHDHRNLLGLKECCRGVPVGP